MSPSKRVIEVNMKIPFQLKKEGSYYISSCCLLDVHSQGETEEKAVNNLVEALSLFLSSCFERGVLDEVLQNCGLHSSHNGACLEDNGVVDVPLSLVANNNAQAHAC